MREHLNLRAIIALCLIFAFLANTFGPQPLAQAQEFHLPAPGVMVRLSPAFNPPILKGIKVHTDNPFRFEFILDKGDKDNRHPERSEGSQQEQTPEGLKIESTRLIKYFLASLTIPESDLWVNLSPYEKNRIIPQSFGLTEMGRDLLAEDYMLKQITASLIYPEDAIGKKFWHRIYEEAEKKFGTTNIPVNTFNKVWIVPEKAVVYENSKTGTAYIVESKLKVMLEQDYLSLEKNTSPSLRGAVGDAAISKRTTNSDVSALGSQIVREIVIPALTKEVNENKNFAQLRQVYNSLILAAWYKNKIKDSILAQVYADKKKVAGVGYESSTINTEKIYQRYLQAFKKGAFNYIKEDIDTLTQQPIPRKYFSGGAALFKIDRAMEVTESAPHDFGEESGLAVITSEIDMEGGHYGDILRALNPGYEERNPPQDLPSTYTKPMRMKGLNKLLSIYNLLTSEKRIRVVMLGAGVLEDVDSSPQTIEMMGALSFERTGSLDLTVVDRDSQVINAAAKNQQQYVSDTDVTDPILKKILRFHKIIRNKYIYDVIIPDNTNVKGFVGSFQDLEYGENQVDLIVSTNSLYYSYIALDSSTENAYLALILKLIKALKPTGKLLVDHMTLSPFMPEMKKDTNKSILQESDTYRFEAEVRAFEEYLRDHYHVNIRLRFYGQIVEIERLPEGDSDASLNPRYINLDAAQFADQAKDHAMMDDAAAALASRIKGLISFRNLIGDVRNLVKLKDRGYVLSPRDIAVDLNPAERFELYKQIYSIGLETNPERIISRDLENIFREGRYEHHDGWYVFVTTSGQVVGKIRTTAADYKGTKCGHLGILGVSPGPESREIEEFMVRFFLNYWARRPGEVSFVTMNVDSQERDFYLDLFKKIGIEAYVEEIGDPDDSVTFKIPVARIPLNLLDAAQLSKESDSDRALTSRDPNIKVRTQNRILIETAQQRLIDFTNRLMNDLPKDSIWREYLHWLNAAKIPGLETVRDPSDDVEGQILRCR